MLGSPGFNANLVEVWMLSSGVPNWIDINAFGCMLWALGALLGTQSLARAQDIQKAGRTAQGARVEEIYIARSVRESRVAPTEYCSQTKTGFASDFFEDQYTFRSTATRISDGRMVDANIKTIGSGHGCIGRTADPSILNFYLDLELGHTALQGIGECHLAKSDFPEPGLIALSCFLNLSDPLGRYVGGQLTANDDGWKSVKPWIKEKKVNYPIVIGNEGLGKQYGLVGMPLTAPVDRDGRIADVHRGIVQKMATQEKIRDLLNASLKNPTN